MAWVDPPASELGALTEAQFRELLQARLSEPTLDPIRAHALLCAATNGPADFGTIVAGARTFEAYLRGEPT